MNNFTKNCCFIAFILLLSNQIIGQDIIAQYDLNGNGEDSGINGFNATLNGTSPAEDRFGNPQGAISFDGIDDYLEIANQDQLNFGVCDFAISLWVKNASDEMQMLVHNGSSGFFSQYWLRIKDYSSSNIDLKFITSNGVPTSPSVTYNNSAIFDSGWHHIVAQRKNYFHELYFDGVLVASDENPEIKNIENEASILIGAQHPNPPNFPEIFNFFHGSIDDLVFYKNALSEEQVEQIFNSNPTSTNNTIVNHLELMPNPVTDKISIKGLKALNYSVKIFSASGRLINRVQTSSNEIDLSYLPQGLYFLVFNIDDVIYTNKVIKI